MNMTLVRNNCLDEGIFGELLKENGEHFCFTLEHSYEKKPKLPAGKYTCKRGDHRLASMEKDFVTFEIMEVPGHTGMLFHIGNYNEDSNGCVLVGLSIGLQSNYKKMLTFSRQAFNLFLKTQEYVDTFELTVRDYK